MFLDQTPRRPQINRVPSASITRVIAADGDWDIATVADWEARIFDVIEDADAAGVVLDLSDVSFMGSTGVSLLSRVRARCQERRVGFVLRGPSPQVVRLLTITGMSKVLAIEPPLTLQAKGA